MEKMDYSDLEAETFKISNDKAFRSKVRFPQPDHFSCFDTVYKGGNF